MSAPAPWQCQGPRIQSEKQLGDCTMGITHSWFPLRFLLCYADFHDRSRALSSRPLELCAEFALKGMSEGREPKPCASPRHPLGFQVALILEAPVPFLSLSVGALTTRPRGSLCRKKLPASKRKVHDEVSFVQEKQRACTGMIRLKRAIACLPISDLMPNCRSLEKDHSTLTWMCNGTLVTLVWDFNQNHVVLVCRVSFGVSSACDDAGSVSTFNRVFFP